MKTSLLLVWAFVYGFLSVPAYGTPLGVLNATNGTIEVGGNVFENFVFFSIASTSPAVSDIDVIPVTVAGRPGLRFVGPFFGTTTSSGGTIFVEFGSYQIDFDVTNTDPNALFHDVSHSWPFTHFGAGSKNFSVTTDVQNCPEFVCGGPGKFDFVQVNTRLGPPFPVIPSPGILSEGITLPIDSPFLRVENHLDLIAGSVFDEISTLHPTFVSVPFVEVTFGVTSATTVPEPSTVLLFGPASAMAMALRLRRRKTR
jgi:hypothetical protein